MTPEFTFQEMTHAVRSFRYPKEAAFVTLWWTGLAESNEIIQYLRELGYKVTTYKKFNEVEIRFQYTRHVGSLSPNPYILSLPAGA